MQPSEAAAPAVWFAMSATTILIVGFAVVIVIAIYAFPIWPDAGRD